MDTLPHQPPRSLVTYLKTKITAGHYTTPSDYIQALIQQDQEQQDYLEPLVREGLNSGPSTPMTQDDWDTIAQLSTNAKSNDVTIPNLIKRAIVIQDLANYADYISIDNLDAGDQFLYAAEATFQQISRTPGIGRLSGFSSPDMSQVRQYPIKAFRKYLVMYSNPISFVRVVQASRRKLPNLNPAISIARAFKPDTTSLFGHDAQPTNHLRLLYELIDDTIDIIRVLHGSQNLEHLLKPENLDEQQ